MCNRRRSSRGNPFETTRCQDRSRGRNNYCSRSEARNLHGHTPSSAPLRTRARSIAVLRHSVINRLRNVTPLLAAAEDSGRVCSGSPTGQWRSVLTGYDASGCDAAIWILHAMYRNSNLGRLGRHDDRHGRVIARSAAYPCVGDVFTRPLLPREVSAGGHFKDDPSGCGCRPSRRKRGVSPRVAVQCR
jgi:hypothetical protein